MNKEQKKKLEEMQAECDKLLEEESKACKKRHAADRKIEKYALEAGAWHPLSDLGKYCNEPVAYGSKFRYPKNSGEIDHITMVCVDSDNKPRLVDVDAETCTIHKDGTFHTTHEFWGLFYCDEGHEDDCCSMTYGHQSNYGKAVGFLEATLHSTHDYDKVIEIKPIWVKKKK